MSITQGFAKVACDKETGRSYHLVRIDVMREGASPRACRELSRAFGFDECSTYYDIPRSWTEVDELGMTGGRRVIQGYAFQGPKGSSPIAKLSVMWEGERVREEDADEGGWMRMGR